MVDIIRFAAPDGRLVRIDLNTATQLATTQWQNGRDQTRWTEALRTSRGALVLVSRTLWQGEQDGYQLADEAEMARFLALCDDRQRSEEGDAFLAQHDPSEEV